MNKAKQVGLRILSAISLVLGALIWIMSFIFMTFASCLMNWAYDLVCGFCGDETDEDWNGIIDSCSDMINSIKEYLLAQKVEL